MPYRSNKSKYRKGMDRISGKPVRFVGGLVLAVLLAIPVSGCLLQWNPELRHCFVNTIGKHLPPLKVALFSLYYHLTKDDAIDSAIGIATTSETLITTLVIFYYTVMDNKNLGIPHRQILSYAYGSYPVPAMFFASVILLPLSIVENTYGCGIATISSVIYLFLAQIAICVMVLRSTSHSFSVNEIAKIERKQYRYVLKHHEALHKYNINQNVRFAKHMRLAAECDEITIDRIRLFRKILRIPLKEHKRGKASSNKVKVQNRHAYYYFWNNVSDMILGVKAEKNHEMESIKGLLLEIVEEIAEEYRKAYKKDTNLLYYYLLLSAIWFSVLLNWGENANEFCIEIINTFLNSVTEEKAKKPKNPRKQRVKKKNIKQNDERKICSLIKKFLNYIISLLHRVRDSIKKNNQDDQSIEWQRCITFYILMFDFVSHFQTQETSNKNADSMLDRLDEINNISYWYSERKNIDEEECKYMWDMWSSDISLDRTAGSRYCQAAIDTIKGKSLEAVSIAFALFSLYAQERRDQ